MITEHDVGVFVILLIGVVCFLHYWINRNNRD